MVLSFRFFSSWSEKWIEVTWKVFHLARELVVGFQPIGRINHSGLATEWYEWKPKVQLAVRWTWPIVVTWCENWSRWIGHRSEWHRKLARYQDHWSLQRRFKPIERINHGELATSDTLPSKKVQISHCEIVNMGFNTCCFQWKGRCILFQPHILKMNLYLN